MCANQKHTGKMPVPLKNFRSQARCFLLVSPPPLRRIILMKKYLVEFIGTFFLVLAIGMAVIDPGAGNLAPIAIGAALMVMVYAGGHVSGAHYNPAVTIAVWLRGRCSIAEVPFYLIAQILAAVAAAKLALLFKGCPVVTPMNPNVGHALIAEFVGTFALAYVVLNVATAKATAGNSFYGLAIGFTVVAMAFALGGISGGAFNPAVALGAALMGLIHWGNIWVLMLAEFIAGGLACFAFKTLSTEDAA